MNVHFHRRDRIASRAATGVALPTRRRALLIGVAAASVLALTAACGSSATDDASSGESTVTLALDFTANTSHNGLAAAIEQGYFKDAGINVKVLPYGATSSDSLVATGQADFGITFSAGTALNDFASGLPVKSVMVMYQQTPYKLAVLKDSGITRPAQLAGKTYGGYGNPQEIAWLNKMIENDGGTTDAKAVTLGTGVFQAVAAQKVDAAFFYPGDFYAAEAAGTELTSFALDEYGVPDFYGQLLLGNTKFLEDKPELAKKFVAAFKKGYELALSDPDTANADLLKHFNDIDAAQVPYVSKIQNADLYPDERGRFGTQTIDRWQVTLDLLVGLGLLKDSDGETVTDIDLSQFVDTTLLGDS